MSHKKNMFSVQHRFDGYGCGHMFTQTEVLSPCYSKDKLCHADRGVITLLCQRQTVSHQQRYDHPVVPKTNCHTNTGMITLLFQR